MDDHIARELNLRIDSLGWSKAEVIRNTGISFKTIVRLMTDSVAPTRKDKRRQLTEGLGLIPDAFDRLENGAVLSDVIDPGWVATKAKAAQLERHSRTAWNSRDRPNQDIRDEIQAMLDQISSRTDLMDARAAVSVILKRHLEAFLARVNQRDFALAADADTMDQGSDPTRPASRPSPPEQPGEFE